MPVIVRTADTTLLVLLSSLHLLPLKTPWGGTETLIVVHE